MVVILLLNFLWKRVFHMYEKLSNEADNLPIDAFASQTLANLGGLPNGCVQKKF